MLYITGKQVNHYLTMSSCIKVMSQTLVDQYNGQVNQPLRTAMPLKSNNLMGIMPSHIYNKVFGAKIISVFPNNHKNNIPSHQGVVVLFNTKNGSVKAVVDGIAITTIRTAAVSAVATNELAKVNSSHLALLGAGTQAKSHLKAMLEVRKIKQISVWDYYHENAVKLVSYLKQYYGLEAKCYDSVEEAVKNADIICTVSLATAPILNYSWLKKGVHINAVGACRASDRELDSLTIKHARLFVDNMQSAKSEAGCYLQALAEGEIDNNHIKGDLGSLICKRVIGRSSEQDITVFKSLGLAIEDLAAANFVYEQIQK